MAISPRGAALFILVAVAQYAFAACANGTEPACELRPGSIGEIRLGGPIEQVTHAFGNGFELSEKRPQPAADPNVPRNPHTFTVTKKSTGQEWITFMVSDNKRIILAYVSGPCRTGNGIGVGSTLGEAMRAYGKPELSPTDAGYYVGFRKLPGVVFLLSNGDVPRRLQGFADDEISAKAEREILSIKGARFDKVRLMATRIDP